MFKLGKFPMDYIAANYLSLATGSFIFSFMLGLAVFIQTRYFAEDVESSGKYPSHVNPFKSNVTFLCPLKTSKCDTGLKWVY